MPLDILYLPVIREADYEAFRHIMHDELPPTYVEWNQRHLDRIAYWRCYGAGEEGVAPSALSAPTDEVLHVAAE